jgi:hypothetical protein
MAIINRVEHKVYLGKLDIIKYQILTYCFLKGIPIADGELECLTLLSQKGSQDLNQFCTLVYSEGIYASPQVARNSLTKSERKNLVIKDGKNKKRVFLNPEIQLQTEGNILLDFKFAYLNETAEIQTIAA